MKPIYLRQSVAGYRDISCAQNKAFCYLMCRTIDMSHVQNPDFLKKIGSIFAKGCSLFLRRKNTLGTTAACNFFQHTLGLLLSLGKETLDFTSTETIQAYLGRGSWGVGNFISNTYSLHCHHQNDSALRWAAVLAILMFQ